MKRRDPSRDVLVGGDLRRGTFRFKESRALMETMSRIYEDPIWAVCRELVTNVWDAYQALPEEERKKRPKPKIILPSQLHPTLDIIDYGVGLSHEEFETVFVSYGDTTKDDTDTQVGVFGLGAKSPFSITGHFTVVCRRGGNKVVYACFKGEDKFEYSVQAEKPTEEIDGVTVQVPIKPDKYREVHNGIARILEFFSMDVEVESTEPFTPATTEYVRESKDGRWKLKTAPSHSTSIKPRVIMGMVPYTLQPSVLLGKAPHLDKDAVSKLNLDIFVDIGEVNVPPARETLEYTPHTVKTLTKVYESVLDELKEDVEKQIKGAKTFWEASSAVLELSNKMPLLKSFIQNVRWKGEVVNPWEGFTIPVEELEKKFPGITVEKYDNPKYTLQISRHQDVKEIKLSPKGVNYVLFDDTGAPVARTRHFLRERVSYGGSYSSRQGARTRGKAYLIGLKDATPKQIEAISAVLYGVPLIPVSTTENPLAKASTNGKTSSGKVSLRVWNGADFKPTPDVDLEDGGIFVRMNRKSLVDLNVGQGQFGRAVESLRALNILDKADAIFGVPRTRSKVEGREEWVEFTEYVLPKVKQMVSLNAQWFPDVDAWVRHWSKGWTTFFTAVSMSKLEKGSFTYALADTAQKIKERKDKIRQLKMLANIFEIEIPKKEPTDDVAKLEKRLYKDYPLLAAISRGYHYGTWEQYEEAIVDYIKMMDNR